MIHTKKQKTKIIILTTLLGFFIFNSKQTQAHPLDITATEIHTKTNSKQIETNTFIHPFLIGLLLTDRGVEYSTPSDYYDFKNTISEYLKSNISIKNNSQNCELTNINFPPMDEIEILGGGMEINMSYQCSNTIELVNYSNTLFTEYSPLQTNKIIFVLNDEVQKFKINNHENFEKILTTKITNGHFDFKNTSNNNIDDLDSDNDGLSDAEEAIYKTNPNTPDSDFDGYTDKEEIDNGWDPLDWKPGPEQNQRTSKEQAQEKYNNHHESKPISSKQTPQTKNITTSSTLSFLTSQSEKKESKKKLPVHSSTLISTSSPSTTQPPTKQPSITSITKNNTKQINPSTYFNTSKLNSYLQKIKTLFTKNDTKSILIIFLIIFILGIFHALESGHGKSIMIAHLLENNKKIKDVIIFSTIMTSTHLLDILVLSLIFKLFSLSGNAYKYINNLQIFGAYILLLMGIYYLIKSLFPRLNKERWQSNQKIFSLAFIAGLAPCTIGWAIMILLLSLNKTSLIIPIIITFGLGIFVTLVTLGTIITSIKERLSNKIHFVSKFSQTLSALALITIAIILLKK